MGSYSYKDVTHREDFQNALREWEVQHGEYDGDVGYDGDGWLVAAFLLEKKDAEIAALKERLENAKWTKIGAALRMKED
jgi:hypothetical protein